jgi:hypothetical protein
MAGGAKSTGWRIPEFGGAKSFEWREISRHSMTFRATRSKTAPPEPKRATGQRPPQQPRFQ